MSRIHHSSKGPIKCVCLATRRIYTPGVQKRQFHNTRHAKHTRQSSSSGIIHARGRYTMPRNAESPFRPLMAPRWKKEPAHQLRFASGHPVPSSWARVRFAHFSAFPWVLPEVAREAPWEKFFPVRAVIAAHAGLGVSYWVIRVVRFVCTGVLENVCGPRPADDGIEAYGVMEGQLIYARRFVRCPMKMLAFALGRY